MSCVLSLQTGLFGYYPAPEDVSNLAKLCSTLPDTQSCSLGDYSAATWCRKQEMNVIFGLLFSIEMAKPIVVSVFFVYVFPLGP